MDQPTGTVTFLFTDIEGSTKLWERHPQSMGAALARHDTLMREAITRHKGVVFKTVGDAFCAAFPTAPNALLAVFDAQRSLQSEAWGETGPIRVRMALHTDRAEERDKDYFGPALNRVARLLGIGHGEQTLLSQATYELVRDHLEAGMTLRDAHQHRLKDLQRPEHVYEFLHPTLRADFPPLKSLDNLPNNLPPQLTPLIGREREVADITAQLAQSRLLTLAGIGGIGKTRLSLQVAADTLDRFPDGVWFVELAPLTDPAGVPGAVCEALGIAEEPNRSPLESLLAALESKTLLLVLDNCEHLLDAIARLTDTLLRRCSQIRILASSREGMNINGEIIYRVPVLALPDPQHAQTLESISQYESVRLFVDRAVAAHSAFVLTEGNARVVAQICVRLDGIPLAIQLAAARVRALAPEQIAQRLDDRFRLLTGGSRTALPRQQTLRALIDWSYDLLTAPEAALLRRLSIFARGATLEGVEAVCAGEMQSEIESWEVLDLLTALVDKSLVLFEETGTEPRYCLLETIRQYGRDRLREQGEEAQIQQAHLAFFLQLAVAVEPGRQSREQSACLARLDAEIDNFRAALDTNKADSVMDAASWESRLRIAAILGWYWRVRGFFHEGRQRLSTLLTESESPSPHRAAALRVAGMLAQNQGDYAEARRLTEQALAICAEVGDEVEQAASLSSLAILLTFANQPEEAKALFTQCLALSERNGDTHMVSRVLVNLGMVARRQGRLEEAEAQMSRAAGLLRKANNQFDLAACLNNLAQVAYNHDDFAKAQTYAEESLLLRRNLGDLPGSANTLLTLVEVARAQANLDAARAFCRQALGIQQETGDREGIAFSLDAMAEILLEQGDIPFAALLSGAADTLRRAIGVTLSPQDQAYYEAKLEQMRACLGAQAFTAVWDAGCALPSEQAIASALKEETTPLAPTL